MTTPASSPVLDWVLTQCVNRIGFMTLNRPQAMNALNLAMVRAMQAALNDWAQDAEVLAVVLTSSHTKALCAGGDIRFFHEAACAGEDLDPFFAEEYALNLCIAQYPKPYIALMQGVVMGGGMGISTIANPATGLRVVCDTSKLAMPEVKIGLFPDVGGTHFLSHLPGELGTYLGLTASVIRADSAIYAQLADAYCPATALPDLVAALQTARFDTGTQVRAAAMQFCATFSKDIAPQASELAVQHSAIDAIFSHNTVADMCAALTAQNTDFARIALAAMQAASPLMVHTTLAALRRSRSATLSEALVMERRLMRRCFAHSEPVEGIRALAVDKDHRPRWAHASLEAVTADAVLALFV